MSKQDKAVTAKKGQAVALGNNFEDDAGGGFESTDVKSYAVPFVAILQALSPQVLEGEAEYIPGASPGMLCNTVTGELFSGKEGIRIIPCAYKRQYVEWKPRTSGGGFVAAHDIDEGEKLLKVTQRDEKGNSVLPTGNILADVRMHYVLLVKDNDIDMAIISMGSTQIKKSRRWMTQMNNIKLARQDGSKFTAPMFANKFHLTTVPERNDKGNWFGWKIESLGFLTDGEEGLYEIAKGFRDKVVEGAVQPVQEIDVGEDDSGGVAANAI